MKNFLLIVFAAVSFNCLGQTDLIVHDLLYAKGVESIFEVYHMDQDGNTTSLQDQNGFEFDYPPVVGSGVWKQKGKMLILEPTKPGVYSISQITLEGDLVQSISFYVD